jgi:hypothetical protein
MLKEPRNQFQRIDSASLAGRYENPILSRFLAQIDCSNISAQVSSRAFRGRPSDCPTSLIFIQGQYFLDDFQYIAAFLIQLFFLSITFLTLT